MPVLADLHHINHVETSPCQLVLAPLGEQVIYSCKEPHRRTLVPTPG